MRVLAITSLYPNPFQPNLAPFNFQQFRAIGALQPLSIIAPIAWTRELGARWRGAAKLPAGRRLEEGGITVEHPRYMFPPKVIRGWYGHCFRRSIARCFGRAVAHFQPDVVLAAWAYPDGWAAVKLAHRFGLPVVVKVHGSDILTVGGTSAKWERTAEALQQAEGVLAVSQDLAEKVATFGVRPEKIRVVYNGVDTSLFCPGPSAEARARLKLPLDVPLLLYVGNLFPVKGPDLLVKACAELRARQVRFHCVMVGAGFMQPALENMVRELGLKDVVRFAGAQPHGELPAWFRAADVLVLPSRSEGVPNVLLEAVACGTRFVATRVGGTPEVAHLGTGWLVPAGDAGALAQGVVTSLDASATEFAAKRPQLRAHSDAAREILDALESARLRFRRKARAKMVLR